MPIPILFLGGGLVMSGGIALLRVNNKRKATLSAHKNLPEKKQSILNLVITHDLLTQQRGKEVNRNLVVSGITLGVTTYAKLLYSPLYWLSVPLVLYSSIAIFNDTLDGLINKRKFRSSVTDSVAIISTLASGYYFASAFINGLHFLGQKLLLKTEDHSFKLAGQQADTIWLSRKGAKVAVAYQSVAVGDVIIVNAGEIIPFDGKIKTGSGSVDQHTLTGQTQAQEKMAGESVLAMTRLIDGKLLIQVDKTGRKTVAAQINQLTADTKDFKSTTQTNSVTVANKLTLPTLALGGVVLATLGPMSAITVVTSNFSNAVLVFTPLGVLNYQKLARQQGILIKDGRSLELLNQVQAIVFDVSTLLLIDQPEVTHVHRWQETDSASILTLASTIASRQAHPYRHAIQQAVVDAGLEIPDKNTTARAVSRGAKQIIKGKSVLIGSLRLMTRKAITLSKDAQKLDKESHLNGHSLVFVAINNQIAGAIQLQAKIRPEAIYTIRALQQRGLEISIISGGYKKHARHIAKRLNIENFHGSMRPKAKARYIEQLQRSGKPVCFVGSGIDDTVAMKKAQVSMSLSGAANTATNTANIVMTEDNLEKLDSLFDFTNDFKKDMKTNTALALGPGALGVASLVLFRTSIYGALSLYSVVLGLGAINTVLPLLRTRKIIIMGNNFDQQDKKAISEQADKLVRKYAFSSSLTGFIPVPMLDIIGLMSVQRIMLYRMTVLYEIPFKKNLAKAMLTTMMSSIASGVAAPVAGSALKLIPGVGTLVGGAGMATMGSASTYAVGKVFQQHFGKGGTLEDFDPNKVEKALKVELEKGKKLSHKEKAQAE